MSDLSEESSKRGAKVAETFGPQAAMGGLSKSSFGGVLGPLSTAREAQHCHAEKEVWLKRKGEKG